MCNQVVTPEGLAVCRDTGEVVGAVFDQYDDFDSPQYEPFSPAIHGLVVDVKRPAGKLRGTPSPGARDRVKALKVSSRDYTLVKALKRVSELASLLELPRIAVYDASTVVKRIISSNVVKGVSDCTLVASLLYALKSRGFHAPLELFDVTECPKRVVFSELYNIQRALGLSPPQDRQVSLVEVINRKVEELCARAGCGDAELAKKLVRKLYETDKSIVQSHTVETVAKAAVYLASRLRGSHSKFFTAYARVYKKIASKGLELEVRVKCS